MVRYTDQTCMPFGDYKGTPLGKVPSERLVWIYDHMTGLSPPLKEYIKGKLETLRAEAKRARLNNSR